MADTPFNYETITPLYTSLGVLQNQSTYTIYNRAKISRLRQDIDTLGELLNVTLTGWTGNHFDWSLGDRFALDTDRRLWLSYITDLRTACEDLATVAGIAAPTWTVASLSSLYKRGKTATILSGVLTQTGADFTGVTITSDYCYIQSGTGATIGRYQITAKTTDTLTLSGYSGDSSTGDVEFDVLMTARRTTHTQSNLVSLITDVQTAIMDVHASSASYTYYVDSVNGDDTTGDGSQANPYATWNKAVTQCNSVAGNIYFAAGSYSSDLAITQANITIQGESADSVAIDMSSTTTLSTASGLTVRNVWFGDGTSQNLLLSAKTGFLFERCIFRAWDLEVGQVSACADVRDSSGTFRHCSFFGRKSLDIGVYGSVSGDLVIDDCLFFRLRDGGNTRSTSTGSMIFNYCTFDDVTNKTVGGATFTINNEHITATVNIGDTATMYLYDTSDLITAASDGYDIGAYLNAPYNVLRGVTDTLTVAESNEMSLKESSSDSVNVDDDITSVNMNVSIDMPFWGLFESSHGGVVTYIKTADLPGITPDMVYNGASLDLSWDNSGSDAHEVYIVSDDGVTDYSTAAWWENNALYPAKTTGDSNGTRGYAIDCFLDAQNNDEWGDHGSFSTVTADGWNDQQWDITLKVRVRNVVSGAWSELVTLSKTYAFNTFEGTMAYCADNPRTVDNEYADHANYMLNDYHTTSGSDKLAYTRPDGVAYITDARQYAYDPAYKALEHIILGSDPLVTPPAYPPAYSNGGGIYSDWFYRRKGLGTIDTAAQKERISLYPLLWANYGNWNHNSDHCFADVFNFVYDDGNYQSSAPILGQSTAKLRYISLQAYLGSDCTGHSSFRTFMYWMPKGELMSYSAFGKGNHLDVNSDLFFNTSQPNACTPARFYLESHNNIQPWGSTATYWWFTKGEVRINESTIKGEFTYGASHDGTPF